MARIVHLQPRLTLYRVANVQPNCPTQSYTIIALQCTSLSYIPFPLNYSTMTPDVLYISTYFILSALNPSLIMDVCC